MLGSLKMCEKFANANSAANQQHLANLARHEQGGKDWLTFPKQEQQFVLGNKP